MSSRISHIKKEAIDDNSIPPQRAEKSNVTKKRAREETSPDIVSSGTSTIVGKKQKHTTSFVSIEAHCEVFQAMQDKIDEKDGEMEELKAEHEAFVQDLKLEHRGNLKAVQECTDQKLKRFCDDDLESFALHHTGNFIVQETALSGLHSTALDRVPAKITFIEASQVKTKEDFKKGVKELKDKLAGKGQKIVIMSPGKEADP
ncbi:MAG: hypothetical protein M1828_002975 [Chrysothrix sp. TS-e1954]|nr:MAG: hypothetical protein M1828_002975 [Chrysothrix sp. TS-e1954]